MTGIWQWFTVNSIWILIIAACALFSSVLGWSYIQAHTKTWVSHKWLKYIVKPISLLHWSIEVISLGIVASTAVSIVISREGIHELITTDMIKEWVIKHGIFIVVIILVSYVVYYIFKKVLPSLVESSVKTRGKGRKAKAEMAKRVDTLISMLKGIVRIIIITIATFSIIEEIGVPIAPLLAGAGIVGIAVGFGAQHLIKDFLNGLFIFLEDQYDKGDVVKIAGLSGLVEDINLRRTTLRDLDGLMHIIPNGEITTASNYTKGWSRVNLDISVSYQENLDHVIEVINGVCDTLASDEYFKTKILKTPQVLRISNFSSSGIDIKILGDTQPLAQWEVTGEIRKRIKKAFDEEGIEIPWPHVKLYFGQKKTMETLLCNTCGHFNVPGNRFCSNCGSPLDYLKTSLADAKPVSNDVHEPVKEDTGNS
jgi:moderate conductance mechanosensitive channel